MATTRNKRRALGAAAPNLENLDTFAAAAARTRKNRTASQSGEQDKAREGSVEMDIPGTFTPSPVNYGKGPLEPEPSTDEIDEREADAHISIAMGESTDEEQSKSCPPGESSDSESSLRAVSIGIQPCPTGSTPKPGQESSDFPDEWDYEVALGYSSTNSNMGTPEKGKVKSTTPYQTPNRTSRTSVSHNTVKIDGAKYFSPDVLHNSNIHDESLPEECEMEVKSDETLKQSKKPKRKSDAQQRAEDLAFLNAVIRDNKRRERLEKLLPDIIPNNKSLLIEMQNALRDSSGDEYDYELSEWENLPESPVAGPSGTQARVNTPREPLPSEPEGPSYFDKGKWVSDNEHDAREAYKAARKRAKESGSSTQSEGRDKVSGKKPKHKKPRPSMGLTIDDLRPAQTPKAKNTIVPEKPDLNRSMAALPAGGYLANKMKGKSIAPDTSRSRLRNNSTSSICSKESTTSEESSSSESSDDSDSSSSDSSSSSSSSDSDRQTTMSRSRKRKNAKNRDKYREKLRKLQKKTRKERRSKIQLIEPKLYLGQSDYDQFELWNYEVDLWLKDSGYKGRKAVRYLGSFLGGKAAQWYMDHVAPDPQVYTPEMVKMGLFGYCFPPDMKSKLRDEYKHTRQGSKRFVDYLRELKRYQRRIPDITDKQLCIKLWDTVHTYIKVKWVEAGMNAEESELSALSEAAERFEAAEEVKRKLENRNEMMSRPRHGTFRFKPERHAEGRRPIPYAPRRPNTNPGPVHQPNSKDRAGPSRPTATQPPKQREPKPKHDKPKMSKEERSELRAAGKCFSCKEPGHTVKDCPSRNTAKPSGLFSSALQYSLIEQLRKEREQTYLNVASIQPEHNTETEVSPPSSTISSYGTLEFTPGESLLNEILDQITPYSRIVVAESDKLQITNDELSVEMLYEDIASQVRDSYLEHVQSQRLIANDHNQGMATIPEDDEDEDKWEADGWSSPEDIQLNAVRPGKKKDKPATQVVERNAAKPKDVARKLPKPLVVEATINGSKVRALIDTGSLGDFISTTVVDQLKIKRQELAKPIGLQMAVTGSRSSINFSVTARLGYQNVDCMRRFDVINIDNYDLILGTPFLYQHKVIIGLNPPTVSIGSKEPQPIDGETAIMIESLAAELYNEKIEERREILRQYGSDLCKTMAETSLPPLRAINHTIPLIDETKRYHSRRVQCPKPLQNLWEEKFKAYRTTGRWEYRPGSNAIPMLLLQKKSKDGKTALRTVLDKREINANTYKLASPLPDINDILMEVSKHPYRSLIDGKDAYEQIRIIPEHVDRSLFMTPNGTMVSHVMQQGDCNAGATYQALMNHIFAEYIGKFMFVYLDDIIIFSDSVEEHEKHVKLVFDVLRKEKLYLSPNKMQLFADRLQILGHVITHEGISMDPHKVDAIEKWKVPTTKEQLMSFLGAVGYLAPNCPGIRIPMGVLSKRSSASQEWRWEATEQRAFDEVKKIVCEYRNHNRVALDYSPGAPPINLVTDACCTGASGVVSQGEDLKTAKIVAFWSGKFTATQQNYPVHEQELLAIKESLERFKNLLQGVKVRVFTDHKALEYFATQMKLSPRQTRWMEKINEFDIEVKYIPGETNDLADGLSRMYSNEPKGVVRAESEYVGDADDSDRYILVGSEKASRLSSMHGTSQLRPKMHLDEASVPVNQ
ncbi:Pol polyprotein/retrotransposon, putative, partial [Rhizoctonia solani AG-3 Rhs1AP]